MERNQLVRAVAVIAGVCALIAALTVTSQAGHGTAQVAQYTGCLKSNGTGSLLHLAVGEAPAKPCPTGFEQLHVSGGDITSVNVGTGLTGGGSNGGVAVGLDPAYALPQGCSPDQVLKRSTSAWTCGTDNDTTYSGNDFALSDQTCTAPDKVAGIGSDGTLVCAQDADTTYDGTDFARSNQSCGSMDDSFVRGISANGGVMCGSVPYREDKHVEVWSAQAAFLDLLPMKEVDTDSYRSQYTPVMSLQVPGTPVGGYLVTVTVGVYNTANFVGQDNNRHVGCRLNGSLPYGTEVDSFDSETVTFTKFVHMGSTGALNVECQVGGGGTDQSWVEVRSADMQAMRVHWKH